MPSARTNVCFWGKSGKDLDVSLHPLLTDAVEKVTAEKLWNKNTQQSNPREWILESTLRTGA
jgi:hypothetical protein